MASSTSAFATAADDNAVGTVAWTNPSNALTSNDTYATATLASDAATHYLKLTNASGLSITAGAVISGIKIDIHRKSNRDDASNENVRDNIIKLVKGGSVVGDNKAAASTNWPTTEATASYGGDGDLWGTTWASTDFGANFGVVLSAVITDSGLLGVTGSVDYIEVTVYSDASGNIARFFPFFEQI